MDKKYVSDNKRVILITGDNSKWYEQAIFIVKKNAMEAATTDLIKEAEMIINNYMGGIAPRTPKTPDGVNAKSLPLNGKKTASKGVPTEKQKTTFDIVVNALIIIAAVTLLALLSRSVFGL